MNGDVRFFLSALLRAEAKYWSAFRRAYALGLADRRRDRPYAGHEAQAYGPSRFPGNFNAPMREAYRAGWRFARDRKGEVR
jgi:hypothetical protein